MNKIKIFELINNNWQEGLTFNYVPVGKSFTSKMICFSSVNCNIADLKVMFEWAKINPAAIFSPSKSLEIEPFKELKMIKSKELELVRK